MFHDLVNLFYPKICNCCGNELQGKENIICTGCLHKLPLTGFHHDNENAVKKVFTGRLDIENATALFYFRKKGMVQELIHNLKYRGHREISTYLGNWYGEILAETTQFKGVQAVVPVPLHPKKLRYRGFNQVEGFGKAIAKKLQIEYLDNTLVKKSTTKSQTLKNRLARWGQIEENFMLENTEKAKNKHLLLVDDLITTGATLEACAHKLQKINGVKISIATMAITI